MRDCEIVDAARAEEFDNAAPAHKRREALTQVAAVPLQHAAELGHRGDAGRAKSDQGFTLAAGKAAHGEIIELKRRFVGKLGQM
jgi:hypothetical protein